MKRILFSAVFLFTLFAFSVSICRAQYPEPNKYTGYCSDETAFDPVPYTERLQKYPTRLLRAIAKDEVKCVERILESGESANGPDRGDYEKIPLFLAICRNEKITDLLIEHGANLEARAKKGITPLMVAAICSRGVKQLLDRGVAVDSQMDGGMTALMFAAGGTHMETLKLLLDAGADVNRTTSKGYTALMLASDDGQIVETLIKAGAKTGLFNTYTLTAACEAVRKNQKRKLEMLLKYDPESDWNCR